MTPRPESDPAKARYLIINMVRLFGVGMVVAGLLAAEGRIDLPIVAAYLLIVLGMVEVFLMPRLLARRWRSPE